jgi:sec-independent protein translocase protein TatA
MSSGLRENAVNKPKVMQLNPMLAIFNLGGGEIVLLLAVALILFGGKKLPELAKGLGQGIREFKKATSNASEEMRHAIGETSLAASISLPPAAADIKPTLSQATSDSNV